MSSNNELSSIKIPLTRSRNVEVLRKRFTHEKYFRQAVKVWNNKKKYVDSGYIQINDYTNMCRVVRVLDKSVPCHHVCQQWICCGDEYYKTDFYDIYDFISGVRIGSIKQNCFDIEKYTYALQTMYPNSCLLFGDLTVDINSLALHDAIEKYSNKNAPVSIDYDKMNGYTDICDCRLFEHMELNELLHNKSIDHEKHSALIKDLHCVCEPVVNPITPELQPEYDVAFAMYMRMFDEKL